MHRKFTLNGSIDTQIVCAINTTPKQKWELKAKPFSSNFPSDKWVMIWESPPIDMVVGSIKLEANWSKTSIVDNDPISKLGIGLLRHGEEIVCCCVFKDEVGKVSKELSPLDEIISKSRPGDRYILKYKVGSGGSYAMKVKKFEMKIIPSEQQDNIGRLIWVMSHFDIGKNTCIKSSCTKYLEIKNSKLIFHNGSSHCIGGQSGIQVDDNKDHIIALRYIKYNEKITEGERKRN